MKSGYQENTGNWIRIKRCELDLTQVQLAEQLGVSDASVSNWERGTCRMSADVKERMDYLFARRRRGKALA